MSPQTFTVPRLALLCCLPLVAPACSGELLGEAEFLHLTDDALAHANSADAGVDAGADDTPDAAADALADAGQRAQQDVAQDALDDASTASDASKADDASACRKPAKPSDASTSPK